ncbi:MAG: ARPP-1 family domain-containing protein [Candidatus Thorarchaeota archaeon]
MEISKIIENYTICEPFGSGDFMVYPIVSPFSVSLTSLKEAESLGTAWIQERAVESVSTLEAINNSEVGVLIPFLTQVQGGKQDRTVFEPIILPTNRTERNPLPIPARCVEEGRWGYRDSLGRRASKRFESSPTRVAGQMAHAFMDKKDQGTVWNLVRSVHAVPEMASYHSRTVSFASMSRRMHENNKEMIAIENSLSEGLDIEGQVGILIAFRGRILGVEFYGASNLWKSYARESLRGFLFDKFILDSSTHDEPIDIRMQFIDEFYKFNLEEQEAIGDGNLYRISSEAWQGMCLVENDIPAHLYAVKKQR